MRLVAAGALAAAALVAAAGCAAGGKPSPTGPATADEIHWIRTFTTWRYRFESKFSRVADVSAQVATHTGTGSESVHELYQGLLELRDCHRDMANDVPEPPTARLRPLVTLAKRFCAHVEAASTAYTDSLITGANVEELSAKWKDELERAGDTKQEMVDRLDKLNPLKQGLPVARGADDARSRIEPVLGRDASKLAKKEVRVRCWSSRDWPRFIRYVEIFDGRPTNGKEVGMSDVGGHSIDLDPDVCSALTAVAYEQPPAVPEDPATAAVAVNTFAHETQHVTGVAREAVAECYGMQTIVEAAAVVGIDARTGRNLADIYWKSYYPYQSAGYRSPECRDGGKLDLHPKSSVWP